ncbi:hypothetical protein EXV95_01205 [Acidovorax sp. JMULE5]|uniref:hypothetical protein n=1 Tax=Acidovorax sp. JMULE5 TaxID=2518343 RepID=UPI0015A02F62|nr:hypothetical protein [Acidovorax sp. JMULE5]QLA79404.1 hypothetical protein EXV95_01205 [Acidovorax sp. JMULE5]
MSTPPRFPEQDAQHLERLLRLLKPSTEDPTYLVLKSHLLAEEVLYRFIEKQSFRSEALSDARLGFAQLLALCRAFHRYSKEDWWGWSGLKKLNTLRNLLAHNLEPKDLKEKIVEFSVFVAVEIGVTKDGSEIGQEYEKLATSGTHPFVLALVALHVSTYTALGFSPNERWSALQSDA